MIGKVTMHLPMQNLEKFGSTCEGPMILPHDSTK